MIQKENLFRFIASFGIFCLISCSATDSGNSDSSDLLPQDISYLLYANDPAAHDSVAAHLATGALMPVEPGGSYELSFDADPDRDPPKLLLYRLKYDSSNWYILNRTRKISAQDSAGRWIYRFDCRENSNAFWSPVLVEGNSYYSGKVENLSLTGEGSNALSFSLNLVTVGSYGGTSDSVSLDSLAKILLEEFRSAFSVAGISIDTIYVHSAAERTDLETSYPADKPWRAGYSSSDFFLWDLGGWPETEGEPGIYNALDLLLVHRIEENAVLGYSTLYGGALGGGIGSTIVLGTHYLGNGREYSQASSEIAQTATHEAGHFFGLRHTTSTISDLEAYGDYSIVEDGIDDTPFCGRVILAKTSLAKIGGAPGEIIPRIALFKSSSCPDEDNPMFPTNGSESVGTFTEGQGELLRKNLKLYDH